MSAVIPLKHKIHVRYGWRKYSREGILLQESDNWTHNVFTNHGKNQFLSTTSDGARLGCCIGTGTGAHSASAPRLHNWVSGSGTKQDDQFVYTKNFASTPFFTRGHYVFRFGPAIPGSPLNVTEFGLALGDAAPGNNIDLASVAQIEDSLGNPTAISVQPDEYLDVIAEFTVYIQDEIAGTMPVDVRGTPSTFDYVMAPAATGAGSPSSLGWNTQQNADWFYGPYFNTNTSSGARHSYTVSGATGLDRELDTGLIGAPYPGDSHRFPIATAAAYATGSYYRDGTYQHSLTSGVGNGINGARLSIGRFGYFGVLALWWPNDTIDKANGEIFELTIRHMVS